MRLRWLIVKFGTAKFMSARIVVSAPLMMQKPVLLDTQIAKTTDSLVPATYWYTLVGYFLFMESNLSTFLNSFEYTYFSKAVFFFRYILRV